jgi:hypothetical protein
MDTYERIESQVAAKYGASTTTRKAVGDFMIDESHAVNVKSNNLGKQNYSPNMISIKKMHRWVFEERNDLSFIFVDYRQNEDNIKVIRTSDLVPIEHISWRCLSIEAQGYGVIQRISNLIVCGRQTKCDFYKGFLTAYDKYIGKRND